ncbi:hypothetical protein V22_02150 [Calycomorphotria hydatis]|uniref:Uncharacterized protein n=1 Tax=Calycomorphotria hydatis TaxID=2528027 RepID=A0A517T3R3_9PLAN|nr:hypothetical protein V22_02150 [Calycomorphotria hydatis]
MWALLQTIHLHFNILCGETKAQLLTNIDDFMALEIPLDWS